MNRSSYLALGDSYTIGEMVPIYGSFPYQLVQLLRSAKLNFTAAEIIAKTGWTTNELEAGINSTILLPEYDLITLLIGVNNQYRGRSVEEYRDQFEGLLNKAIALKNETGKIFVLSIPDWGVTPFAEGKNREEIAVAIDSFNVACKETAEKYNVPFLDITTSQRKDSTSTGFVAEDGLHPSDKEYRKWAVKISEYFT